MSIRTIMVHLGTEKQAPDLIRVAADLAQTFTAHLIGLNVVPQIYVPAVVPAEMTGEIMEAQRRVFAAAGARIAERFNQAMLGHTYPYDMRKVDAMYESAAAVVIRHSLATDLIVLGQSDDNSGVLEGVDVTEEVMLGAGRPTLIVPVKAPKGPVGRKILVAWNESREASRAAFDALPFLQSADNVRILSINERSAAEKPDMPGAEIAAALGRHNVHCQLTALQAPSNAVADIILGQVDEHAVDLLVMGGYGHSRLREFIFGGATRAVLSRMTVPVLMSH